MHCQDIACSGTFYMGSTTAKDQKLVNFFDEYYGNLENPLYSKVMRVFYLSMYVHYDRRANL